MQADETQNDKGSIHVHTIKNEMEWAKFAKEVVPKNSPELAEVLFETENKEVKKKRHIPRENTRNFTIWEQKRP